MQVVLRKYSEKEKEVDVVNADQVQDSFNRRRSKVVTPDANVFLVASVFLKVSDTISEEKVGLKWNILG